MLSVGLSTSAALAGQQKPTHTRVVSPKCNAQCIVAVNSIKVDTSYRGVAETPTMCMKSRWGR